MKANRHIAALFAICCGAMTYGQDLKVRDAEAIAVNKDTVVEYTPALTHDQRILWNITGPGKIDGDPDKQTVKVKPTAPGDISVSYTVITRGVAGQTSNETKPLIIHVPGPVSQTSPGQSSTTSAPAQSSPAKPAESSKPAESAQTTPPGDLDIITEGFVPSGYQGDAQQSGGLVVDEGAPGPQGATATKLIYTPPAQAAGWVALSWLAPNADPAAKAWGLTPGLNYSNNGFESFRLMARAEKNGTVQFKSGGSTGTGPGVIPASYQVSGPTLKLTNQFKEYCLNLQGRSLTNVFSALTVVLTQAANPGGAEIYIADMRFSPARCQ